MSDQRRLQDKLEKLMAARAGVSGARRLEAKGQKALQRLVLQEIDETILARLLTLKNEIGATIGLEVSNRRVLRFIQLPADDPAIGLGLVDQAIDTADGPEASMLLQMLGDLIAEGSWLQVGTGKIARDIFPTEIGCSAQALSQAWGFGELYPDAAAIPDQPLQGFVEYCQNQSQAWLCSAVGGDDRQQSGSDQAVAHLSVLLDGDMDAMDSAVGHILPEQKAPRCVLLSTEITGGATVLIIKTKSHHLACLLLDEQEIDVLAQWQGLF